MICRPIALWAALALVASVLIMSSKSSMEIRSPFFHRSFTHLDISSKLDAKAHKGFNDGVHHDSPDVPDGSQLISLPVGQHGEKVAVYWSASPNNPKVEHAFVMMHGRLRDGDHYWTVMNNALKAAQKANYGGAWKEAIVVAPELYSTKLNKGQYDAKTLAWGETNAWQAGGIATHPKGTNLTSMDALDAILDHFSDRQAFPSMKNITLVGHGGGGQLMNRYAATGKDPKDSSLYVRYIVGDPSSSPYFTHHRPVTDKSIASKDDCHGYDNWRYGFADFPGTLDSKLTPKDYFKRYLSRDVLNIVGLKDVEHNGDQKCMALLQGGHKRRDRNFSWWRYVNSLAKTSEDLSGFPGNFSDLPDWSDTHNGSIGTRLAIVEDASHNAAKIFSSKIGRSALFDHYSVDMGWRPAAWHKSQKHKSQKNKAASQSSSSSSSGSSNSSSSSSSSSSASSASSTGSADRSSGSSNPVNAISSNSASSTTSN